MNNSSLVEDGIYPEYSVKYNIENTNIVISGRIDLLIKKGKDLYLIDYKTGKKLNKKGYFDIRAKKMKTMLYPLGEYADCNFYHYSVQLALYAYMLKKIYPDLNIKRTTIAHYDEKEKCTYYDTYISESNIKRLLVFFKKDYIVKRNRNNRIPIKY